MKKIYYFTTYYPNRDVQWKTDELNTFVKFFDIEVVPFENKKFEYKSKKINGIKYSSPLFDIFAKRDIKIKLIRIIFSKYVLKFILEAVQNKVFFSKIKLILWVESAYKILMLSKNQKLNEIFKNADKNTVLYFFWGRETSEIIGFLKTKAKIIVRYHGYDLYEERSNNYIPFRKMQLKNSDIAVFISEHGETYLKKKYSKIKFNTLLSRLGTRHVRLAKQSNDDILRIVSCSSVIPLKRVWLIADALLNLDIKAEWTHIGGGSDFEELKQKTKTAPENIKISLTGYVPAKNVPFFYKNVDLFINVSTKEGVPVSIMEAMAAGIPVLATDVGGTSEIVNEKNGKLLPANLTSSILADEIKSFYNLSFEKKQVLRKNAYETFEKEFNILKNTKRFATIIQKTL